MILHSVMTCYLNLSELGFQRKQNSQREEVEVKFTDQFVGWRFGVHEGIPIAVFRRNNKWKRHVYSLRLGRWLILRSFLEVASIMCMTRNSVGWEVMLQDSWPDSTLMTVWARFYRTLERFRKTSCFEIISSYRCFKAYGITYMIIAEIYSWLNSIVSPDSSLAFSILNEYRIEASAIHTAENAMCLPGQIRRPKPKHAWRGSRIVSSILPSLVRKRSGLKVKGSG